MLEQIDSQLEVPQLVFQTHWEFVAQDELSFKLLQGLITVKQRPLLQSQPQLGIF